MKQLTIKYGSKEYKKDIRDTMFYETFILNEDGLEYEINWNTNNDNYIGSYLYYDNPDTHVIIKDKSKFTKEQFDILINEFINTIKEYRNIDPNSEGVESKLHMDVTIINDDETYNEKIYSLMSLSNRPYIILDTLKRIVGDNLKCPMFLDRFDHEKNLDRDIFIDMI